MNDLYQALRSVITDKTWPGLVPVMEWGDDWEERLLAILDKPYELEMRTAA